MSDDKHEDQGKNLMANMGMMPFAAMASRGGMGSFQMPYHMQGKMHDNSQQMPFFWMGQPYGMPMMDSHKNQDSDNKDY